MQQNGRSATSVHVKAEPLPTRGRSCQAKTGCTAQGTSFHLPLTRPGTLSAMLKKLSIRDHVLPQPESFYKKRAYELHGVLGEGTFGKVIRATWTPPDGGTKKEVALKAIPKKKVKGNEEVVWGEMQVLEGLDHPNIVRCSTIIASVAYLTMNIWSRSSSMSGLSQDINTTSHSNSRWVANSLNASRNEGNSPNLMPSPSFGSSKAMLSFGGLIQTSHYRSVLSGVSYLHEHDIVHRDLKLESLSIIVLLN